MAKVGNVEPTLYRKSFVEQMSYQIKHSWSEVQIKEVKITQDIPIIKTDMSQQ